MGMFFIMLLTCLGIGLIEASVEAREADRFVTNAVARIEAGDYSEKVIDAVRDEARQKSEKQGRKFDFDVTIVQNDNRETYGTATLIYEYRLAIIGMRQTHTITADIR